MAENKKSPALEKPDLNLKDIANIPQESFKTSFISVKVTAKLSNRQRKVLNLLKSRKCSAADISISLHYSDPRSYIRELREKNINVKDEWVSLNDVRFKKYWVEEEEV